MKAVLIRPNYDSHIITPPLGLGYLSSSLKKAGIKTKIIDGLKESLSVDDVIKKTIAEKPDVVGITCLTAFYNETREISKRLKAKGMKVVIGGVHPTFLPLLTLKETGADYVICGEGEIAFPKLIKAKLKNKNIQGVYSLKNLKNGTVTKKGVAIENLDDLPFPDWEQINPNTYPKAPHGAIVKNFPIGVIMTTRGCPYMCSFCASPKFYERKIRFRSPEKVIEEIKYLIKNFGIKEVHFEDDNLTLKREHVEKLCNLIIENKLKFSWACPNGIRADRVDEKLLRLMKKSGCYYVAFGIESANPTILKNIHKLETIETIEKAIKTANKIGLITQGFFIFGLPGESKKTIRQNIDFAKKSRLARAQFIILDVLPGSELWDTLKGKFTPNWKKKSYKEPEWVPAGLTKEYLMKSQSKAFREFYLRPRTLFRLAKSIRFKQAKYLVQRLDEYRILSVKKNGEISKITFDEVLKEIKNPQEFNLFLRDFFTDEEKEKFSTRLDSWMQKTDSSSLVKRVEAEQWANRWAKKFNNAFK